MSLLDLVGTQDEQVKAAAEAGEGLEEQAVEMYKVGWDLWERQLMKAAQEAEGEGKPEGKKEMSPEEEKEQRKQELIAQMKKSPEKKEEIKKEVGA